MVVTFEQKLSLPLLFIGEVLFAVSLAEPHWFSTTVQSGLSVYYGLWKFCVQTPTKGDVCVSYSGSPGWITGPEVLECMALSCALAATGLSMKMLFKQSRNIFPLLAFLLSMLAGVLGASGAALFYHKQKENLPNFNLAFSFFLHVIGDAVMALSSPFLLLHALRRREGQTFKPLN